MRKLYKIILLSFTLLCSFKESTSISAIEKNYHATIAPLSDGISWRYKTEGGKLYKRLYNYTKNRWVGNWILVK